MSDEIWRSIVPHLPEIASVDFSGGGEPLMNPGLVDRITIAKAAGCITGFLTNGMLLTSGLCQKVLTAGVDWVGFSLDGADDETYHKEHPDSYRPSFLEHRKEQYIDGLRVAPYTDFS